MLMYRGEGRRHFVSGKAYIGPAHGIFGCNVIIAVALLKARYNVRRKMPVVSFAGHVLRVFIRALLIFHVLQLPKLGSVCCCLPA